ncbi:Omp28-related outer membrane protein [Hymenobacter sp. ASUV-10]|uniref:Omp28-related outer membrane protein n=1 Tax=Hymenobacter aranciens TaxID=3063996 RepID=A0ABT9B6S1_9BACT|nr:Omp28-related outer membrane protein [Hymenobacter sp. ASUV-10]MDO7873974.1 Omp28-related outer membrane protein [Hymenobacter sp. ASUV-10]
MKKISFAWVAPAVLLTLGGLAALPACDVIDNPQPEKVTLSAGRRDTLALDSAEALLPAGPVVQNVLIDDYTGQYCGNCPRAAHMADSMERKYPGRVFGVEVHATDYFAAPRAHFPIDFRAEGVARDLVWLDLDNRGLPQGAVNRAPFPEANNSPIATFSLWPNAVANQLALSPTAELRATPLFDPVSRLLRLKVNTKYLAARPGVKVNMGIMVVEDSVIGAQKDYRLNRSLNPDQTTEKYKHHNVLRAAIPGIYGAQQVMGPTAGQQFTTYLGYSMADTTAHAPTAAAPSKWNARSCSVIVFLSDADSHQILQVVKSKFQ